LEIKSWERGASRADQLKWKSKLYFGNEAINHAARQRSRCCTIDQLQPDLTITYLEGYDLIKASMRRKY
jgi:hypothetical protein